MIENSEIYIRITFTTQIIDCIRDNKGTVKEGHPSNIVTMYMVMDLQPELINPDFSWRIMNFRYQKMYSIM